MFHKAIKVSVVTEKLILEKVCQLIEKCGATGYTIVPAGGKGRHHLHPTSSKATVVDDFSHVKIEIIVKDKQTAADLTDQLMKNYFENYAGITYVEEVDVIRPERFGL